METLTEEAPRVAVIVNHWNRRRGRTWKSARIENDEFARFRYAKSKRKLEASGRGRNLADFGAGEAVESGDLAGERLGYEHELFIPGYAVSEIVYSGKWNRQCWWWRR